MYVGVLEFDLLFGDVHSLKEKRAVLRPLLARLRRLSVAVAEVGDADLHRRGVVGVAAVSGDSGQLHRVLDECERQLSAEVEVTLLSAHRRIVGPQD